MPMDPPQALLAVILGAVAIGVGIKALGHAFEGLALVRHRMAREPRIVTGMVWALTLVALGGIGGVIGGLVQLVALTRR